MRISLRRRGGVSAHVGNAAAARSTAARASTGVASATVEITSSVAGSMTSRIPMVMPSSSRTIARASPSKQKGASWISGGEHLDLDRGAVIAVAGRDPVIGTVGDGDEAVDLSAELDEV